jgi:hypothetical protein
MRIFRPLFLIAILSFNFLTTNVFAAGDDNVLVVKTDAQIEHEFRHMAALFKSSGTDAIADHIHDSLGNPETLNAWRTFVASEQMRVLDIEVHPNEQSAVKWINGRFKKMGIPNLEFNGVNNEQVSDPTALPNEKISGRKWLRYLAGPGAALAAAYIGLPDGVHLNGSDYLYLIIPAVGVGVTTVALELQFAWPWLNNKFWKKVFNFGGAVGGRIANTTVNFLYGMALYGAGVGSSLLPTLWGDAPVPFETKDFTTAISLAIVGGIRFHFFMGQYQTDIRTEEIRGTISSTGRYGLEASGVVVNNSARVYDSIDQTVWGTYAQSAFFLVKTLPQLIKTHLAHRFQDAEVKSALTGIPNSSKWFKCAQFFSNVSFFNLPKQRKE